MSVRKLPPGVRHSAPSARFKFLGGDPVGAREIEVIASDPTPDRVGDILEPTDVRLEEYRTNPIVLAQHDPSCPIARCSEIGVRGSQLVARIQFPPPGTSDVSDQYLALVKSGVLSAVSVGFIPHRSEPLRNGYGLRFTDWELVELSIVSVPANPSALVTQRSLSSTSHIRARTSEHDDDRAARRRLSRTIARVRAEMSEHDGPRPLDPRVTVANAAFRLMRW